MAVNTELLSYLGNEKKVERLLVRVIDGPAAGSSYRTEASEFSIGSGKSNEIVIDDSSISAHHISCSLRPSGVYLVDLESKNGTHIGDLRVEACTLPIGGEVRIGRSTLRFEASGEQVTEALSRAKSFGPLIGNSPVMRSLFAQLQKIADSDIGVLIQGETGSGKELVAQALHEESCRRDKPFVIVDCGAVSAQLIQSELFGHKKGAFTGADSDREGAFEAADGGTLFLDEIGELALELQPILLRALESGTITRVGETRTREVKVRLVAATNRDLRCEANHGRFREDLYYRLSRLPLRVPPLRERKGDIAALATLFAQRLLGDTEYFLDAKVLKSWARARWPGNVRELKNAVERQVLVPGAQSFAELAGNDEFDASLPFREAKELALRTWAQQYLNAVLHAHDGHMTAAAESMGIDRNHLRRLMRRYAIG